MSHTVINRENNNIANVSLGSIKASIGIYDEQEDVNVLLQEYLGTAYELAAQYIGYPINAVTKQFKTDNTQDYFIRHSSHTVIRDLKVKYYDENNNIVTTNKFSTDDTYNNGTKLSFTFEDYHTTLKNPISIEYTEHIAISNMTQTLNSAIILLVKSLYENQGGKEINPTAERLLDNITDYTG